MKIYENANDQHVRKVVLYEVGVGLAFDEAGTELLTKEEIIDAFLKGCVVENEGNYKTPTGVNVTNSGAELVFGGSGGSGGPEVENAIATHGMGWTSEEEVVHQIDEKYIPQGSFVIDYSDPKSDDYEKAIEFFDANRPVYLSKDSSKIPMTGYNSTHCFFGGTVSAYLPGGYVICVYAHIGPEGTNYFWYQYNSPVEVPASAMVVEFKAITESGPFECNHTIDEVKEALKTGNVVGVYFTGDTDSGLPLGNATAYCSGDIGFYFQGVDIDSGVPTYLFTSDSDSGAVLEKFGEWGFTGF